MNIYELIIDRLKLISKKDVSYGYIEDLSFNNYLMNEDKYILNLRRIKIETVAINHRKQKERELLITYTKFNELEDNSLNIVLETEKVLDQLVQDEELKRQILNMDYEISLSLEKENEDDITGVLIFEINLTIKER